MSQGSFTLGTSGQSTVNYTNDTNFSFVGGTPYTGSLLNGTPDWTQVVIGYSGTEPGPSQTQTYTSNWTISGTHGTGKILQILFQTGPGGGRHVIITLAPGGGTLQDSTQANPRVYIFQPPQAQPDCFVTGTRILTDCGYKAVETLQPSDYIVLSDGRKVDYVLNKFTFTNTNELSAPYRIEAGAFGPHNPKADICLSPRHKVQIRKGVWISPEIASKTNKKVRQYGIGEPVTYWHIQCKDYLKDNLVCEGMVIESFGTRNNYHGPSKIYTWNKRLGGFTRPASNLSVARI